MTPALQYDSTVEIPGRTAREIARFLVQVANSNAQDEHAAQVYRWALEFGHVSSPAYNGLGLVAMQAGRPLTACHRFRQAAQLDPDNPYPLLNLASALTELEKYAAAGSLIDEGIALASSAMPDVLPELLRARCFNRFSRGDWAGGWCDWEYRESRSSIHRKMQEGMPSAKEWDGKDDLSGESILVIGEHGIGDQIMFARYVQTLSAETGAVIYFKPRRELVRLFEAGLHGVRVLPAGNEIPQVNYWIGNISLPQRLGIVDPPPPLDFSHCRRTSAMPRVGICWHGGPILASDSKRSTPLEAWLPLLDTTPGVQFVSLQYGETPDARLEPLGDVADMLATAQRMHNLDLVITVDTSIAHLAGSMGIPTWMLCYRPFEWRWSVKDGVDDKSTPWYPTMRLFRQEVRGLWAPTFEEIRSELAARF